MSFDGYAYSDHKDYHCHCFQYYTVLINIIIIVTNVFIPTVWPWLLPMQKSGESQLKPQGQEAPEPGTKTPDMGVSEN